MAPYFAGAMGFLLGWNFLYPMPEIGWHLVQVALGNASIVCYVRAVQLERWR